MIKYLFFIVIIFANCNVIKKDNRKKISFLFDTEGRQLRLQNDTFYCDVFNYKFLGELDEYLVFSNENSLYSYHLLTEKIDSVKFWHMTAIDGYKLDEKLKMVVVWQLYNGGYESYLINKFKCHTHYFLNRNDIIDMNFSNSLGFIFILSNYFAKSNTLVIYPNQLHGEDVNDLFHKKERQIPIGKYSKIGQIFKNRINVLSELNDDSCMVFPYKNGKSGEIRHFK